ncbi:Uncharacterized protein conserved in bacteria [Achromobacter xylosoxidans]|uniref:DUF2000 family protein n=1 Tax=Alcaligenes xylosoxydans xylosoxydans TaxID=85698 RepID=UPI0006C6A957|nr:DUF2000 family protein [Achromobacter xylosoxidans]QQE58852.1 DUF2000 family protein [Achromobacter xylosoxidans]QQV12596.1 DUF2000 family protein [Achromobacter xylosoxidans]UXL02655.1 DUF2000 domain-containing protein [Achromobacter xylosoxidans]CUI63177.1 Uncharacterized protein conserved in bacteria [Achromobacter xylosoxidans]CUJ08089.1 Uncharacterized protein conserved in bacteria [Achromobacter xylosoxidans]
MPEPSAPLAAAVPEKVVIVLAAGLGAGQAANASACLAAGLVARQPNWAGQALRDADGMLSSAISHLPIIVLTADEARMAQLRERLSLPMPGDAGMTLFPAYAREIHEAAEYWARHRQTSHRDQPLLGVGLAGPRRWINALTGSLPMLR